MNQKLENKRRVGEEKEGKKVEGRKEGREGGREGDKLSFQVTKYNLVVV
jgi:hypothetical protein